MSGLTAFIEGMPNGAPWHSARSGSLNSQGTNYGDSTCFTSTFRLAPPSSS